MRSRLGASLLFAAALTAAPRVEVFAQNAGAPATRGATATPTSSAAFTMNDALDITSATVADLSDDGRWLALTSSVRRDAYGQDYRRDGDPTYVHPVPVAAARHRHEIRRGATGVRRQAAGSPRALVSRRRPSRHVDLQRRRVRAGGVGPQGRSRRHRAPSGRPLRRGEQRPALDGRRQVARLHRAHGGVAQEGSRHVHQHDDRAGLRAVEPRPVPGVGRRPPDGEMCGASSRSTSRRTRCATSCRRRWSANTRWPKDGSRARLRRRHPEEDRLRQLQQRDVAPHAPHDGRRRARRLRDDEGDAAPVGRRRAALRVLEGRPCLRRLDRRKGREATRRAGGAETGRDANASRHHKGRARARRERALLRRPLQSDGRRGARLEPRRPLARRRRDLGARPGRGDRRLFGRPHRA